MGTVEQSPKEYLQVLDQAVTEDRQSERFNLKPLVVGLDAGYQTAAICKGLEARDLHAVIGYRRPSHRAGYLYKRQFDYDAKRDRYRCPNGQWLVYRTTDRQGYRHYASDPTICRDCALRAQCTSSRSHTKVVTRHVWADSVERVDANRLTPAGKRYYARRKETVERSFADAKQLHGHRYARFRGLSRVQAQCLLAAACQNMKKIALLLARLFGHFTLPVSLFGALDWDRPSIRGLFRHLSEFAPAHSAA